MYIEIGGLKQSNAVVKVMTVDVRRVLQSISYAVVLRCWIEYWINLRHRIKRVFQVGLEKRDWIEGRV